MKKAAFISILIICILSCEEQENKPDDIFRSLQNTTIDCDILIYGLESFEEDSVASVLNNIMVGFHPIQSQDDNIGHRANFDTLIDRMNKLCPGVSAQLLCYACIETLPQQSEILIEIDSSGYSIFRVLDILTPDDDSLQFVGMHRYSLETGTLQGVIRMYEGNCMPGPDMTSCNHTPISTTVFITEPIDEFQFDLLVDSVVSNDDGTYQIILPVGSYSLFLRDTASIVCDYWSSPGGVMACTPFEIKKDSITIVDANIDHAVW